MFEYRDAFLEEIGGIDAKSAIAVPIIRTPQCEEPTARGVQRFSVLMPAQSSDLGIDARKVRQKLLPCMSG
jgi:hypothetical protein